MEKANKKEKVEKFNNKFPSRLRDLMSKKLVTRQDLAKELGITPQQVSNYTVGTSLPDFGCIYKLAKFFNVSADYLLGLADSPNPDINIREISNITGLTEESIGILQHNTKRFCEWAQNPLPQEALKYILEKYPDCNYPKFHIINLLLADRPIDLNYLPILDALGDILAFNRQPINNQDFYGLFKKLSLPDDTIIKEEYDLSVDYALNESPHYLLAHNDIWDILLLKLQGTINRYKNENDKGNKL